MVEVAISLMGALHGLKLPHLARLGKAGDFVLEGRRRVQGLGKLRLLLDQGFLLLLRGSVLELHLPEMKRLKMLHVDSMGGILLLQGGAQLLLLSLAGRLELLLLRLKKSQLLLEPAALLAQGIPLRDNLA